MSNMDGNLSEDFSNFIEIVKNDRIWYKCTLCPNKEFQTKSHRRYHQYWHDKLKPKPYNCATCGAGFIVKSHYNYHLGTHAEEKPYKCPTCKKGFLSRSKLNRHVRIHSGKVFQCQHCVKKFATTIGRKQHEKTHSSRRPLRRGNSRRRRATLGNSRRQASTSEEERPSFPCTTCDKEFKYAKDLKRHVLVHTGERKFVCLICKEKHQRKDNLMRHIRKVHDKTEESAREFLWEEGEDEEPRTSRVETSELSEEDTDIEMEESSSEDGSSSSESSDSESEISTEDDDDDVEMANEEDEGRDPEICNALSIEGEDTADVDAISTVTGSMGTHEPPSPEPMMIADADDHFKKDEAVAVAEVIFDKDALVITRVPAKVDDEKIEMSVAPNEFALDVVPNDGIKDNVEDIVGDITHSEGGGIAFQEEAVDSHNIHDHVYSTLKKAIHNDHSYAYVEYLTEAEDRNDSNLETTAAIEAFPNEGEFPVDCEAAVAVNEDEMVTQLLFSLKEKPTSQQDLMINNTSVNDIVYSTYLERKKITREFLSFMYEDASNKENELSGNITVIDEFGVSREMEAGGMLTIARDRDVHVEPLLIQKIILYSSHPEPIFCTIQDTIIVNQQQHNDIVELHYWSTTEDDNSMDNFNQEVAFNDDSLIKEEGTCSNEENTWNGTFSLDGATTMNAMESNYMVVGLVGPEDVQNTGEHQPYSDSMILQDCTGNSSGNASESYGVYYGDQYGLPDNDGNIESQVYFGDFQEMPGPNTDNAPEEECLEKDMDKQVDEKVKLIQIPKKRRSSCWNMNEHN